MAESVQFLTVKIKVEENIMAVEAAPDEERDFTENHNKDEQSTEQKDHVAMQDDHTTESQNSEGDTLNGEDEEEEDRSFSSFSTVVSCLRRSRSSDLEQERAKVRKDSRSRTLARQRRLLRLGQRDRARRLLKVKRIYTPKRQYLKHNYRKLNIVYQRCSSALSTDESYGETADDEAGAGTSGMQRGREEEYTLFENEDSTSSSDGTWRAF